MARLDKADGWGRTDTFYVKKGVLRTILHVRGSLVDS